MSARKICDECAGLPVHAQRPRRRAAARDDRGASDRRAVLEADRDAAPFAASTSASRAESSGSPASSSSPVITTTTFIDFERAGAFSALSACTMMTSPPFMSMMPGPRASVSPRRSNFWNGLSASNTVSRWPMRRIFGPAPRVLRDQVPGALERGAVDPPRLEAERVELLQEDLADLLHALEVLRAAVDVDDALEQRQRLRVVLVDEGGERLLFSRKAIGLCERCQCEERDQESHRLSLYAPQFAGQQRHRAKRRLAELSCVHADCPLQAIRERLS